MRLYQRPGSDKWWLDLRPWGKVPRSTGHSDRQMAEKEAYAYLAELNLPPKEKSTLGELVYRYLAHSKIHKTGQSHRCDRGILSTFSALIDPQKLVSEITPSDIERWKNHKIKSTAPATVNRNYNTIRAMFTQAVTWNLIEKNPCDRIKRFKEPLAMKKAYSKKEINEILKHSSKRWKVVWKILLNTGMRRGEFVSLKWADISDVIKIHNTKEGKPKVIPVTPHLKRLFKALPKEEERVFPVHDRWVTRAFTKVARKAKVGGNLHQLRHTAITTMLASGVPPHVVAQMVGHASLKTTTTYSHATIKDLQKAVSKLKF